ncbi:MAG: hypothetical protein Q8R60_19150 [Mycobacteriales bacterium]|nr:hypothetical protein [Mycobacteriales bacterium]
MSHEHSSAPCSMGGHRYWGSGAYVWNNDGDAATLRNAAGSTLDTCSRRGGSPGYTAC